MGESNKSKIQPGQLLLRTRINNLFDGAFQKPFVVVNAGPGFGKTTAVSQYLSHASCRTVWVTLAQPDNIPARFWKHLTGAYTKHRQSLGEKMQAMGYPETFQTFVDFLSVLAAELYQDDKTVVFVFDELHVITNPVILDFLQGLVSSRMENCVITFITRNWPVASLVSPIVPCMIGAEDLRFSYEETMEYFTVSGLDVDHSAVNEIHHYISGWPIALSLVTLALRRGPQSLYANTVLTAAKPELYSLFEQEIFSQYTEKQRNQLVKISVLESFPKGLVQAVTGENERELFKLLENNQFIQYNADTMRLMFQPLYREFLREKRLNMKKEELCEAYVKGAKWCYENGHYYDAINYYKQCECYEEQWEVMSKQITVIRHTKFEADYMITQIKGLPESFQKEHPMTRIVLAMMLTNNTFFSEAEQVLHEVRQDIEMQKDHSEKQSLLGEWHIVYGLLFLGMGQKGFDTHFQKAAELLPNGSRQWRGRLQIVDLGPGLTLQNAEKGELRKSVKCFTQGVPHMAKVLHGTGQGLDKLCECEALFLTGDLKKAIEPAYQAMYSAEASAQYDIVGNALFMLLRIYTALGDYSLIMDSLEHVRTYEKQTEALAIGIWDVIRGWFNANMGVVEKVAPWIRNPISRGYAPISVDRAILLRLRCLIAAGQNIEALALINPLERIGNSKNATITLLYVNLVRAVAYNNLGQYENAVKILKEVYQLSKSNKTFMPLIEYGSKTRSLIEHVQNLPDNDLPKSWLDEMHRKSSTYAKRWTYLVGRYNYEQRNLRKDFGLTPRETELLMHLSTGFTREEIAESMFLSINTVKSLTKQIYIKLGAINAADAVRISIINNLI